MLHIFVDADACPVKQEVYRVASRFGLDVTLVANSRMRIPNEPWIALEVVANGLDAADDWIVEHVQPHDIVVTADIPLASRCLKKRRPRNRHNREAVHGRQHRSVCGDPRPVVRTPGDRRDNWRAAAFKEA